jgi:hypothetical protein
MTNLDTYLQPHYDPSVLTINLHLSPLDWQGCKPAENGLRVFSSRYPEGAKVSKKIRIQSNKTKHYTQTTPVNPLHYIHTETTPVNPLHYTQRPLL